MTDTVDYHAIAADVLGHFENVRNDQRIHMDTFDKILKYHGLHPTGAGRKGRFDWNYARQRHRKNLNTVLRHEHQVSLEVKSKSHTKGVFYYLRPVMDVIVGAPLVASISFARQVANQLRQFHKMIEAEFPPPPNASPEQLNDWQDYIIAKARNMQEAFELDFRMVSRRNGLGNYLLPPVPRMDVMGRRQRSPRKVDTSNPD